MGVESAALPRGRTRKCIDAGMSVKPGLVQGRKPRARKRLRGAPTHVRTLSLRPTPAQRSMFENRFMAGTRLYNACLGRALTRLRAMRADPTFEVAKAMPRGARGSAAAGARQRAFTESARAHQFTEYDLMSYASSLRQAWVKEHVPAQEAQVIGRIAFRAVQSWQYAHKGKPRFKSRRDTLRSMASKDGFGALHPQVTDGVITGFLWGAGHVIAFAAPAASGRRGREQRREWAEVSSLILEGKVLSSAIVKTVIRGKNIYTAHLTVDGVRPQRHPVGNGIVSLDLGPSIVAVVTSEVAADGLVTPASATLVPLAEGITFKAAQLRRTQRKYDRQHRAGSPDCFDTAGRHQRKCLWHTRSKASDRTRAKIAELHRRIAAHRKLPTASSVMRFWLWGQPSTRRN